MSSSYQLFSVSDNSDNERQSKKKNKSQNATSVSHQDFKATHLKDFKNPPYTYPMKVQKESDPKQTNAENSSSIQVQKSPTDSVSTNVEENAPDSGAPQKIEYKIHLNAFNTVLTPEELKNLSFEDSRHYKVLGESRIFYTRAGNLSQKIKEIHNHKEEQQRQILLEEKRKLQEEVMKNTSDVTQKSEKIEEEENYKDLFEYDKNNRYFQQEQKQQMTCRRCKQPGHFERMCMIEIKNVCYYCMGDHLSHECKQRICFNCNQLGHMGRNCPNQGAQRCQRCQKSGHIKADCGAILFWHQFSKMRETNNRFHGIEEEWKKTDDQKIKCLSCHRKGHLNCKEDYPESSRDEVYGQHFQERMQRLRRKEEESKFQGKIINFHYIDDFESSSSSTCNSQSSPNVSEERRKKKEKSKKKSKKSQHEIGGSNEDIQIHVAAAEKPKEYKKDFKKQAQKEVKEVKEISPEKETQTQDRKEKKEKKQKKKRHEKYEESDLEDGRFDNLLARNMLEEQYQSQFGSDIYLSGGDINEDDYDYGNDDELDYEQKRVNRIQQKRKEEDRSRERSKQKQRNYEQKNFKSNDRNIFNKSKSDRYFTRDNEYDQHNGESHHHNHHHKSRSEGRGKNHHSHSKGKHERDQEHSVFVDRTQNHKHKHIHHRHDDHYYERDFRNNNSNQNNNNHHHHNHQHQNQNQYQHQNQNQYQHNHHHHNHHSSSKSHSHHHHNNNNNNHIYDDRQSFTKKQKRN